jgi:hypothetical protein
MAQLEILDDQAILDYTTDLDGKGRVLTDHRDLNLRFIPPRPVPGGVYDVEIFGSPMSDRCICGKIRKTSKEPCPNCGARVYSVEEGLRRFARIELPFYYLNELRFDIFKQFFDLIFSDTKITLNFADSDLKSSGYTKRGARKLGIKVFDSCQFEYSAKKKELVISEFITDESLCSYEGILKIIKEHFPDRQVEFERLVNRYYLVQPSMMRPFGYQIKNGKKLEVSHKLSVWYQAIIRLCCAQCDTTENIEKVLASFSTPGEKVRYIALLRALLNVGKAEATELLNSSKDNLARGLYSVRTKNSARCPIIPSTTLPIDQVSIPRHLAYEMCRSGFCDYLVKELNFTRAEAARSTREEYENPEIQKLFKEYAEKQYVINVMDQNMVTLGEIPTIYCM